jgi:hypothetical protein
MFMEEMAVVVCFLWIIEVLTFFSLPPHENLGWQECGMHAVPHAAASRINIPKYVRMHAASYGSQLHRSKWAKSCGSSTCSL